MGKRWSRTLNDGCRRVGVLAGILLLASLIGRPASLSAQSTPVASACNGGFTPTVEIVLELQPADGSAVTAEQLTATQLVVAERAALLSPDGCTVQVGDESHLVVQLGTVADANAAAATLARTGLLEIVDPQGAFLENGTVVTTSLGGGANAPAEPVYQTIVDGDDITSAYVTQNSTGQFVAGFELSDEAAGEFSAYTGAHIGQPIAILVDKVVVSVPIVNDAIDKQGVIVGNLSLAEVQQLVIDLDSGALPVPVAVTSLHGIGATAPVATPVAGEGEIAGVQTYEIPSANHSTEPITYPQSPPVGGDHAPIWQNCGFYSQPVANENAVHSLEHGAVWITYLPTLPPDQVDALRQLSLIEPKLLVSQYPGQDSPIVVTSWGRQLKLDSVDDPRLLEFISRYQDQSTEPMSSCSGGVGSPEG